MTTVAVAIGLVFVLLLFAPARRWLRTTVVMVALIAVLAFVPQNAGRESFDITATSAVVIVVGLAGLTASSGRKALASYLPLLIFLGVGLVAFWSRDDVRIAGTLNLLLGVAAWAAGSLLAQQIGTSARPLRYLAIVLLALVSLETVVTALQTVGVEIFMPVGRTLEIEGDRANGTYAHPSVVGKIVLLLLPLLLPLTRLADETTRKIATAAVFLSVVPVALSQSRANFVAVVAAILIWSMISPRASRRSNRALLVAGMGVVALIFLGDILTRFEADPAGGAREHFTEVALKQIVQSPVLGVGPSSYLDVVGAFDPLTSLGWPVHNIFLLEVVEIGIVGTVLLFLPALLTVLRALPWIRSISFGADHGRAVLATVPGIILVAVTGWGLMAPTMFMLWFFAWGYANERQRIGSGSAPSLDYEPGRSNLAVRPMSTMSRRN